MREIRDALKSVDLHRTKAGMRHVLRVRAVQALATEPDLLSLAVQFLNDRPIPFRATLFDKSATSNWLVAWHQDTTLPLSGRVADPAWGPWTVKGGVLHANAPADTLEKIVALRVHLEDSAESNGPLRVLPGTHAAGVLSHDAIQRAAASVRPVDCVASAGGVVAMRPLVVHASSKSTDERPRRVLHLEYAASLHIAPGVELAVG